MLHSSTGEQDSYSPGACARTPSVGGWHDVAPQEPESASSPAARSSGPAVEQPSIGQRRPCWQKAVPADNEQRQEQRRASPRCTHSIYSAHSHGTGRESGGDLRPSCVRAFATTGTYARTHVHVHTYACTLCHINYIIFVIRKEPRRGGRFFPSVRLCVCASPWSCGWMDNKRRVIRGMFRWESRLHHRYYYSHCRSRKDKIEEEKRKQVTGSVVRWRVGKTCGPILHGKP